MHPRWFPNPRSVVSTLLALSLLLVASVSGASAQAEHLGIIRGKLQADFEGIVDAYEGVAGIHVLDLTTGDRFSVQDDLLFPQASAIKVGAEHLLWTYVDPIQLPHHQVHGEGDGISQVCHDIFHARSVKIGFAYAFLISIDPENFAKRRNIWHLYF